MKQTRIMSLIEAVANVVVGYGVAVVAQMLVFPVFGLHTTLVQNLAMGAVFSAVSVIRSFGLSPCGGFTRRSGSSWANAKPPPRWSGGDNAM